MGSPRPVGNLPGEVTSFVGRRREVAQAVRLLRRARLLTLTGTAGVGKTRLALRVAIRMREAFPDGVWLVELAALTDEKLLAPTVADALGVRHQQGQRSTPQMLADYLADKRLLLVLDNCEHLLDPCAVLTSRLLRATTGVRILATSRQGLTVAGEHLLEVPPLPVPDPGQPVTPRALARGQAVRLFAERAALARPGFAIDAGNRATIVRICHRLDGIPLAIELAALRVRAMPVTKILTGLDDYLGFLTTGSRVTVPRAQTLRAAIDWSFALCSPPEQQLWARASVFAGGFDLAAAEAVCGGMGIACEDVFDLVAGLIDKSVLTRTHEDTETLARYRMLEALRHYGQERLASSGHLTAVHIRHRDHYPRVRTTMAMATAFALVIQLIPVAPPRMIDKADLTDTALFFHQSVYGPINADSPDQLSAMPSVHVIWAVIVGYTVWRVSPSKWRWIGPAHTVMTITVVVATANHYWADGIVGVALLMLSAGIQALVRRAAALIRRTRVPSAEVPAPELARST